MRYWYSTESHFGLTVCGVAQGQTSLDAVHAFVYSLEPSPSHRVARELMSSNVPVMKKILVIEDDASVRQLMAKHFRRQGFEVSEAADAASALSWMRTKFDLILTDVHLPDQSGVELARRIHEATPTAPIIFVTGDPDEGLARDALETGGAAGYLVKPFRLFELDAVVDGVLSRSAPDEVYVEDLDARGKNRITHLFDALDVEALEVEETGATLAMNAERAAALQAVLDAGDAYDVVEPRYALRLRSDRSPMLQSLPHPRLNLKQALVLIGVILLGILLAVGLPGSRTTKSGVFVSSPAQSTQ